MERVNLVKSSFADTPPAGPQPLVWFFAQTQIGRARQTPRPSLFRMSTEEQVREQLCREFETAEFREIRDLWKRHSMAEDARDVAGLISTLTEECLYQVLPGGQRWRGHAGATRFYTQLLTSFPISTPHSATSSSVRRVCSRRRALPPLTRRTGSTYRRGEGLEFDVLIFFPWDPEKRLFAGERVHFQLGAEPLPR